MIAHSPLFFVTIVYFINRFKKNTIMEERRLTEQESLAIMSILMTAEEADFVYLKEQTQSTAGNLSVQIDKLLNAGYISVVKGFVGKKTRTTCSITPSGQEAFEEYVNTLRTYLKI